MKTKFAIFGLFILVMSLFAGAASAQEDTTSTDGDPERRGTVRTILEVVAEETGLTAQEIFEQVRDGATLAEVIEANGGSVQNVTDALLAEVQIRVDEAVASERITQERADEILAEMESRISEALNSQYELRGRGERLRERFENNLRGNALSIIAENTGLELAEIRQAVAEGATLAEVIESNGGDVAVVSVEIIAQSTERVNELVADGTITQEQADEFLAELDTRVDTFLNRTWQLRDRSAPNAEN